MRKTILFLALVVALANQSLFAQVPSYVPTNGLVGYWPFNGNANDESGNGNNGNLLPGVTYTINRNNEQNKSLLIDGVDGGVPNNMITNKGAILPSPLVSNSDLSISLWFQIVDLTKGVASSTSTNSFTSQTIICGLPFATFNVAFNHPYVPNKIMSCIGTGNNWVTCSPNNPINWDFSNKLDWHHMFIRKSSNNISYFLDGNVVNSTDINFNFPAFTSLQIGGIPVSTGEVFSGRIDDIGVWNRALSDQEITNLYNSVSSNECLTMTINTGVLSTNPFTYISSVSIYPNPANDQITIDCGNLANVSGWSIKITNMLGQEVFSKPMNTQQYVVPLNTWSGQGMYFVKIINAQNEVVNIKKIILH